MRRVMPIKNGVANVSLAYTVDNGVGVGGINSRPKGLRPPGEVAEALLRRLGAAQLMRQESRG